MLVTCRFPERIRHELRRGFDLDEHDSDEPLSRLELLARAAGVHGQISKALCGQAFFEGNGDAIKKFAQAHIKRPVNDNAHGTFHVVLANVS